MVCCRTNGATLPGGKSVRLILSANEQRTRRRTMKKTTLLLLAMLTTLLSVSVVFAGGKTMKANLSGKDACPSVKTKAKGEAKFNLSDDGKKLNYTLVLRDIENPTAAYIYVGEAEQNGTPIATLYSGPKKEGKFRGNIAQSSLTDKNLNGEFSGKSIAALLELIKSGKAYVNVQTDAYPDGEIRGQIK
jgi:hypothetical protein